MSYSHSVDTMNGDIPIKEHWYRCDITGEMIHESHEWFHVEGTDIDISYNAVHALIMPWYVKTSRFVPFEMLVDEMKAMAGINEPRRPSLAQKIRKEVLEAFGGKCVKCGSTDRVHVDHIVPVAKGGTDARSNLQALCQPCNNKKGTKCNEQFMQANG